MLSYYQFLRLRRQLSVEDQLQEHSDKRQTEQPIQDIDRDNRRKRRELFFSKEEQLYARQQVPAGIPPSYLVSLYLDENDEEPDKLQEYLHNRGCPLSFLLFYYFVLYWYFPRGN